MERSLATGCACFARHWWRTAFTLDLRALAAFRIGLGLILVADCLMRFRTFPLMFSADGVFPPDVVRAYQGTAAAWSLAFGSDSTGWAAAVLALEGLAGAFLALGCGTRAATIAAWALALSIVHRTAPATYSGDVWLICLLFWAMFLPLGAVWSIDGRWRRPPETARAVCSVASVALVLQVAAVYLGAGLAKCNGTWTSGEAMSHALSIHDHGTPLGMLIAEISWLSPPVTWSVLMIELAAPFVLVLLPGARTRLALATLFMLFHVAVCLTMSVGLFAAIGMTAWTALLPSLFWDRVARRRQGGIVGLSIGPSLACAAPAVLSVVSFAHFWGLFGPRPLPSPVRAAIVATGLVQEWSMFGEVPPQEQWVYGEARLADGRIVDLLRGGRALETNRPAGGFGSLAGERWHKLFWVLPRPQFQRFREPVADALVRDWNATHAPGEQVQSLEVRFAMQARATTDAPLRDVLIASWPPRGAGGEGNLDRLLRSAAIHPAPEGSPRR